LAWASCLLVFAEDFFHGEDKEDEEEDDVDFPAGAVAPAPRPKLVSEEPREPFAIRIYDPIKKMWRRPLHETEHNAEIDSIFKQSWHDTVELDLDEASKVGHPTSKKVTAGNLKNLFGKFLNPTDELMTGEEEVLLHKRVSELREHEGLLEDTMPLAFGYLCRGKPWDALHQLMAELFELRATMSERRLQEEIAANREQPLLERRLQEKNAAEERARRDAQNAANALDAAAVREDRRTRLLRLAEKATARVLAAEGTRGNLYNPTRQPQTFQGSVTSKESENSGAFPDETLKRPPSDNADNHLVESSESTPSYEVHEASEPKSASPDAPTPVTFDQPDNWHGLVEVARDQASSDHGDLSLEKHTHKNDPSGVSAQGSSAPAMLVYTEPHVEDQKVPAPPGDPETSGTTAEYPGDTPADDQKHVDRPSDGDWDSI
jgi:hypothetical protein